MLRRPPRASFLSSWGTQSRSYLQQGRYDHTQYLDFIPVSRDYVIEHPTTNMLVMTFNQQHRGHVPTLPAMRKLSEHLQAVESLLSHGLVLLQTRGGGHFINGMDMRGIARSAKELQENGTEPTYAKEYIKRSYHLVYCAAVIEKPTMAWLDGHCAGIGAGIAHMAPLRAASERTCVSHPECAFGYFPDNGASYILPHLAGNFGMFMALTGYRLRGMDALHAGVATHWLGADDLASLSDFLSSVYDLNYKKLLELLDYFQPAPMPFSFTGEDLEMIDEIFDPNHGVEEVLELLGENMVKHDWAQRAFRRMRRSSPLSLEVTHKLYKSQYLKKRSGEKLLLGDAFAQEYQIAMRFMESPDFLLGVNNVIFRNRDQRTPQWKVQWGDVSPDLVEQFFTPVEWNSHFDPVGWEDLTDYDMPYAPSNLLKMKLPSILDPNALDWEAHPRDNMGLNHNPPEVSPSRPR